MISKKRISAALLAIIIFTASCAKNPVSGMPDFVTITEQQELGIGASYHAKILEGSRVLHNKELNDYFENLGQMIAKKSHRPNLNWQFTLIDDPTFNAFATPGGYIYFYRGILPYFNSEEELAGVLGHEIGHITARHAVRGMSTAQITNLLIGIVASRVPGGQITDNAFNLLNMAINRGYSRKFELEADQLAKDYLEKANYDTAAIEKFLKIMNDRDNLEIKIAKAEGREPAVGYHGIFSSHPDTEKRITEVKNNTGINNTKKIQKNNKERFLKMIDGLVYGQSPDEGYVKKNTFYHPDLAIKFSFTEPWLLENNPDNLILNNETSKIIIRYEELLRDDIDNGLTPEEFLNDGIKQTSFLSRNEKVESERFNNNSLIGYSILYTSKSGFTEIYKRFTAIFDLEKKPKVWIFVSTVDDYSKDKNVLRILKTFSKMTSQEIKDSKGLRIKVIRFRKGMTYEKLAKESPLGKYAVNKLRLLNGHYPDKNPEFGDLIKVVE